MARGSDVIFTDHSRDRALIKLFSSSFFAVTQSEQDRSCILLVRMQKRHGDFVWVHVVLQVRDGHEANQQPVIVCTNQVLR